MDRVLYFVANPSRAALRAAEEGLGRVARQSRQARGNELGVAFETSPARALAKLRNGGADGLVIDARGEPGSADASPSLALIRQLFDEHEVARVLGRASAWLVVDGDPRGAVLAFEAGRLHLGGVIAVHDEATAWEAIWQRIGGEDAPTRGRKIALCLAGGGTEGLLYELGVLRALSRFLPDMSLADVDIICGISAGAILGGLLANGLGPEAIRQGLKFGSDKLEPLRRSDMFDPNVGELAQRAMRLSWDVVRGKRTPISALFRLPPAGIFAGAGLRSWLERTYRRPGMTDRFDDLPHRLFIGATDQDTNEHVVFGPSTATNAYGASAATPSEFHLDGPMRPASARGSGLGVPVGGGSVPIHLAIRASSALAPFYAPEKIGGRYYVDGGFTRTTNMRVAVEEGATLVILVDPLVPMSTSVRGHVAERGAIYGAMQGLKSLINGRFDKAVPTLRAMYPQVAFHLFQPGPATCRVMAGSPMKYFFREEIEEIAFRETTRDINARRLSALSRDFERHGVRFVAPEESPPRAPSANEGDIRVVA